MTTAVTKESLAARIAELESGARSLKEDYTLAAYKMLLATMEAEPDRNPVLAYDDSYRDMAKQGVESVPIWSVITDLERNIAPLYSHAQPAPALPLPDVVSVLLNHLEDVLPDDAFNLIDVKAWNAVSMLTCPDACRAAMLNQK